MKMKTTWNSIVLAVALLCMPGLASAGNNPFKEIPVHGTAPGGLLVEANLTVEAFLNIHGSLWVKAKLNGTVKTSLGVVVNTLVDVDVTLRVDLGAGSTCDELHLVLLGITVDVLDVLGVKVTITLPDIIIKISASLVLECEKEHHGHGHHDGHDGHHHHHDHCGDGDHDHDHDGLICVIVDLFNDDDACNSEIVVKLNLLLDLLFNCDLCN